MDVCCKLVILFRSSVVSYSVSYLLPEVMSSVAWRFWVRRYDEGWVLYCGGCDDVSNAQMLFGDVVCRVRSPDGRKEGPDSQ